MARFEFGIILLFLICSLWLVTILFSESKTNKFVKQLKKIFFQKSFFKTNKNNKNTKNGVIKNE